MRILSAFLVVAQAMLTLCAPANAADTIAGRWIPADRTSIVEIKPCGANMCGVIEQIFASDQPATVLDRHNAEVAMQARKLEGVQILTDFSFDGSRWNGTAYNPYDGKTYTTHITRAGNHLKVEGCVLIACQNFLWWRLR